MSRRTSPVLRALVAGAAALAAVLPVSLAATSEPASAASCEFRTYQYVVTGQTVTLFDGPGGSPRTTLYRGDIVNSTIVPNNGGSWLVGNAYTPSRLFIGSGWVLRGWTSYTGTSFCG